MEDMNSRDKLLTALNSKSHFFIIEGDIEYILSEIELYYRTKRVTLSYIDAENLSADNARIFISELLKRSLTENTVYVVTDFQNVEFISQNILLKSLETLHTGKRIIAICEHNTGILDTIMSRAYHLYLSNPRNYVNSNIGELIDKYEDGLEKLKFLFDFLGENDLLASHVRNMSIESFSKNKKNCRTINYILEYFRRIERNCNKDLCADLLIYRIMEDK